VRTIKAAPVDLIDTDKTKMLPLPPVPLPLGWHGRVRLGRDYYVRLDSSDYSVGPVAIGRLVDITADLERVRVLLDGRVVADHARGYARGATVTDPVHVAAAETLSPGCAVGGCDRRVVCGMPLRDRMIGLVQGPGRAHSDAQAPPNVRRSGDCERKFGHRALGSDVGAPGWSHTESVVGGGRGLVGMSPWGVAQAWLAGPPGWRSSGV
jgi:hypothetical protein